MNREIKFRAKDKDGCWRYGNLATGIYKGGWCPVIQEEYEDESLPIMESLKEYWIINNKTIGQYTGLKAKGKQEIYEGDYIKAVRNHSGYECEIKGIVKYGHGSFYVEVKYPLQVKKVPMFELSRIFKLGNIYENPELLEEE